MIIEYVFDIYGKRKASIEIYFTQIFIILIILWFEGNFNGSKLMQCRMYNQELYVRY